MHMCRNKPQFSFLNQKLLTHEPKKKPTIISDQNTESKQKNVSKQFQLNRKYTNQKRQILSQPTDRILQQSTDKNVANSVQLTNTLLLFTLKDHQNKCQQQKNSIKKNSLTKNKKKRVSLQLKIQENNIVNRSQRVYRTSQRNIDQDLKIVINTVQRIKLLQDKQHPIQKYLSPYIDYLN